MPRRRRYIQAGRPYELEIRVKSGLPFACLELVQLLLESAMARTQRDDKVKISKHIWNGNHLHMLLVPYDAEQCVFFYQELQKKITESMKRLLGVARLNLWEGDAILSEVLTLDDAISRIGYFYANPAAANLVDTIDDFPGFSCWKDFLGASTASVDSKVQKVVPWIRLPSIPKLGNLSPSRREDRELCETLRAANPQVHTLVIYPYVWLGCLGINSPEEIAKVKARIIDAVRCREAEARAKRDREGKPLFGAAALLRQPIMAPHTPPPRDRRVFVHASDKKLRMAYIEDMKEYDRLCKECYRAEREGRAHPPWPPGAIRPWLRPVANAIADIGEAIVIYTKPALRAE